MSTSVTNSVLTNPLPTASEVFLMLQGVSRVSYVSERPASKLIQRDIDDIRLDSGPIQHNLLKACKS